MLQLRDYQREAIDSLYRYWDNEGGSPLLVCPTGGGKSLILATIMQELLRDYPDMRILCVTHVKELLVQNLQELRRAKSSALLASQGFRSRGIRGHGHRTLPP